MYSQYIKRICDVVLSILAMVILSPIYIILYVIVYAKLGNPVIFTQARPGLNEKVFNMYKFRTMNDKKDAQGNPLPDAERLTRFGKFLRSTSLDELPELFNILKGDMSIVGPRPLLTEYLCLYNEEQHLRHKVRPGLTGWAQVKGRNSISWEEKFNLDVWYTRHISFLLDLRIIFMTIQKVFTREGINEVGVATAEKFKGGN